MENGLQLPPELISLIEFGVTVLVTWLVVEGLKALSKAFGRDLTKPAKVLAAVLSSAVVSVVLGLGNALLALVPGEYVPVAVQFLTLLVVLLGAMGFNSQSGKSKK